MSQSDVLGVPPSPFPTPPIAPRPTAAEPKRNQSRLRWLGLWVAYFAVVNLLFVPALAYMSRNYASFLHAGLGSLLIGTVILSQMPILTFASLDRGSGLFRQAIAWSVGLLWLTCYAAGIAIGDLVGLELVTYSQELYAEVFTVPFVFCVCQTPLWILRSLFRWRLALPVDTSEPVRVSIGGIMAATAILAVSLSLCRVGLLLTNLKMTPDPRWGGFSERPEVSPSAWWGGVGNVAAATFVASAIVIPTTTALVLRSRSARQGTIKAFVFLAVCFIGLRALLGLISGGRPAIREAFMLSMNYLTVACHLVLYLSLMRSAGYRLWWGRETAGPAENSSQAASSELAE